MQSQTAPCASAGLRQTGRFSATQAALAFPQPNPHVIRLSLQARLTGVVPTAIEASFAKLQTRQSAQALKQMLQFAVLWQALCGNIEGSKSHNALGNDALCNDICLGMSGIPGGDAGAGCKSGTSCCALLLTFSFSAEAGPSSLSVSLRPSHGNGPAHLILDNETFHLTKRNKLVVVSSRLSCMLVRSNLYFEAAGLKILWTRSKWI